MKKLIFALALTFISVTFSSAVEAASIPSSECTITASNFNQGDNSDGYIHKGRITLYRVVSGIGDTFELYKKSNTRYVKYKGVYYKIDGVRFVTINNIKYKTY